MPLVQNFLRRRVEMIGELELAYEMCECPIVAITGTNGKTTTTQLVETMLNGCGVKTVAAGNIGPAFSARVRQSSELDLMTLEVSLLSARSDPPFPAGDRRLAELRAGSPRPLPLHG